MKLQSASKKEIARIALGSVICLVIMIGVFFLLSCLGIGKFHYTIILGGAVGTAVAILNFTILCLTVQNVAGMENGKPMKARVQLSYNLRLGLQAGWVVVAFLVPVFHALASAIALLFPTIVLYYLQFRGKLVQPSARTDKPEEQEEEPEDHLGSFEV